MLRTFTGERLVDIAADVVRRFVDRYDPPKIYLFVSGGKDSAAAAAALAYAGDSIVKRTVVVYNELAGNTHPWNVMQTYGLLESLGFEAPCKITSPPYVAVKTAVLKGCKTIHIVAHNRYGEDFWRSVERWGIPVQLASGRRWCYNEFKQKHWDELPAVNGKRYIIVGVKATDSHWRRKRWSNATGNVREFRVRRLGVTDIALSPLLWLSNNHVWQLLKEVGIRLETYEHCGDSLNCVFCPFRSKDKQRRIVRCLWGIAEDDDIKILLRALRALRRAKQGSLTQAKAREWIELIEEELARLGAEGHGGG